MPEKSDPDSSAEIVFVETLTDEELSVVARPGPMPVLPFLDDLPPAEREVARRSAYRSLLARGIVDPPTPEAVAVATALRDGSVDLRVRRDIASVVALRDAARVVVAIARTTAVAQDFWYAHLVDDVVLLEEVSGDGLHRFALAPADRLVDLSVGAGVHPDAGDAAGPPLPLAPDRDDPTPPDDVLERLGVAFLRADLVVRRPADAAPPVLALFTGPGGCWVVRGDDDRRVAEPVSGETARSLVAEAVSAVRAEAVTLDAR